MAWNLLMSGYQRRIGYTWIEFGRRMADGTHRYLTLGAGLSAATGKTQVESWFFILEGAAPEAQVAGLLTGLRCKGESVEEIAAAAHYLASDDAELVTGASLMADGGWSVGK